MKPYDLCCINDLNRLSFFIWGQFSLMNTNGFNILFDRDINTETVPRAALSVQIHAVIMDGYSYLKI